MVPTKTVLAVILGLTALALTIEFFSPPPKLALHAQESLISAVSNANEVDVFNTSSAARNIKDAFAEAGKEYYPEDIVSAVPDPSVGLGSVITVHRANPVTLIDGKKQFKVRTWANSVQEFVSDMQIQLGKDDKISPALNTPLDSNAKIVITRVARTTITETVEVSYKTIIENDYYTYRGSEKTVTNGVDGVVENKYLLIRQDGELISKTLIAKKTVKPVINKKIVRGALVWYSSRCDRYKSWAVDASLKYGINPNALYYRMFKESSCTPTSVSSAAQKYSGLLQYEPNLWVSLSAKAGYGGASIWDPKAQIYTTAWAWANGHRSRWPKDPASF